MFPILNLNAQKPELLDKITDHFQKKYSLNIIKVAYEFQKDGNEMLVIKPKLK